MSNKVDLWLEKFNRELGIKSSIILHGNTSDIMLNNYNHGQYESITKALIDNIKRRGFTNIIKWDRVDGIDYSCTNNKVVDNIASELVEDNNCSSKEYDMGDDWEDNSTSKLKKYEDINQFFPFVLQALRSGKKGYAIMIDYTDFIFGSSSSLSENERHWIATLGKALESSVTYNLLDDNFNSLQNVVILITRKLSTVPPSFYLNNPIVSDINIPLPGRNEREYFIDLNKSNLYVTNNHLSQEKSEKAKYDDFIDSLDGFTLKDIAQMMKLSRQIQPALSYDKLLNLYKYGEKTSPWEELSKEKLKDIENRLKKRVKGQDEAVIKVKDVIIRAYTGFSGIQHSSKQKKPKGTLFFVGPTGVGKTELAKALAEFLFGDESACIRFDMSEFNHEHSDQRLVGAPPGYVGYEEGGQLTNAIKEKPFCVLLFDEIEKANGKILDKFLQILEDGRLTDGKGETVYFSEAIIIFTSNIGAANISANGENKNIKEQFLMAVKKHFVESLGRPELLNRIGDNIVAFNFINNADFLKGIAKLKFESIRKFVKEKYKLEIEFQDEDAAFDAISVKSGIENGGRGVLNVIENSLVNNLSNIIFEEMEDIDLYNKIVVSQPFKNKCIFDFKLV